MFEEKENIVYENPPGNFRILTITERSKKPFPSGGFCNRYFVESLSNNNYSLWASEDELKSITTHIETLKDYN